VDPAPRNPEGEKALYQKSNKEKKGEETYFQRRRGGLAFRGALSFPPGGSEKRARSWLASPRPPSKKSIGSHASVRGGDREKEKGTSLAGLGKGGAQAQREKKSARIMSREEKKESREKKKGRKEQKRHQRGTRKGKKKKNSIDRKEELGKESMTKKRARSRIGSRRGGGAAKGGKSLQFLRGGTLPPSTLSEDSRL